MDRGLKSFGVCCEGGCVGCNVERNEWSLNHVQCEDTEKLAGGNMLSPPRVTEGGHPVVRVVIGVIMVYGVICGGAIAKVNLYHLILGPRLPLVNRKCTYSCDTCLDERGEIAVGTQNANLGGCGGPVVENGLAGGVRCGDLLHCFKEEIVQFRICLERKKRPSGSNIDVQVCNHTWRGPRDVFLEPLGGSNETVFLSIP